MKAELILKLSALFSIAAAVTPIVPNPTTLVRCKNIIQDRNYKANRVDCTSATQFCFSKYWRYEFKLEPGEACFIGPEDFGNYIVDMSSTSCSKPLVTGSYTYAEYPNQKDKTNI